MNEGKSFFALLRGGMGNIFKFLHILFVILLLGVWTFIWCLGVLSGRIYMKVFRCKKDVWIIKYISKIWSVPIVWSLGLDIVIIGLENLRHGIKYIVASNHLSALDVVVIPDKLPLLFRTMAKDALFKIPFFGWALKMSGIVKVERDNKEQRTAALEQTRKQIRQSIYSYFWFPEGTRSRNGELREFKSGAFRVAISCDIPVVTLTIVGIFDVLRPEKIWEFDRKKKITLIIGEPIETKNLEYEDRHDLAKRVREEIKHNLSKYS